MLAQNVRKMFIFWPNTATHTLITGMATQLCRLPPICTDPHTLALSRLLLTHTPVSMLSLCHSMTNDDDEDNNDNNNDDDDDRDYY